jgi:hypothetical protein
MTRVLPDAVERIAVIWCGDGRRELDGLLPGAGHAGDGQ